MALSSVLPIYFFMVLKIKPPGVFRDFFKFKYLNHFLLQHSHTKKFFNFRKTKNNSHTKNGKCTNRCNFQNSIKNYTRVYPQCRTVVLGINDYPQDNHLITVPCFPSFFHAIIKFLHHCGVSSFIFITK